MTRQKVRLSLIENESARRSTFRKRKTGILKKAHELATLCGVPISVIIKSAYDSDPEVWPSREAAQRIASQWKMLPPVDQTKRMVDQETFIQQRISKATDSWRKLRRENRELEMKELMFGCMSGKTSAAHINKNDIPDLGGMIEQFLRDVNRRIEILHTNDVRSSSSVVGAGAGAAGAGAVFAGSGGGGAVFAGAGAGGAAVFAGAGGGGGAVFAGAGGGGGAAAAAGGAGGGGGGAAGATFNGMPMSMDEIGSSSAEFYERIRNQIENSLNLKQINKDLDLNKKQW